VNNEKPYDKSRRDFFRASGALGLALASVTDGAKIPSMSAADRDVVDAELRRLGRGPRRDQGRSSRFFPVNRRTRPRPKRPSPTTTSTTYGGTLNTSTRMMHTPANAMSAPAIMRPVPGGATFGTS
jgi:hypothetical protein